MTASACAGHCMVWLRCDVPLLGREGSLELNVLRSIGTLVLARLSQFKQISGASWSEHHMGLGKALGGAVTTKSAENLEWVPMSRSQQCRRGSSQLVTMYKRTGSVSAEQLTATDSRKAKSRMRISYPQGRDDCFACINLGDLENYCVVKLQTTCREEVLQPDGESVKRWTRSLKLQLS